MTIDHQPGSPVHRFRDPDGGFTSLKIMISDKRALERLQARIVTEYGEKLTLNELVGRAIALTNEDLAGIMEPETGPLPPERWLEFLASIPESAPGPIPREEDIDRDLLHYHEAKMGLPPKED